jgi:hypothetical protein
MTKQKIKLKKWSQIYPQGTKEGDEEQKFFIGLNRQSGLIRSKYEWRSTEALVKESGLSRQRVEEIITKYVKLGLIFASHDREDHWGYWERDDVYKKCIENQNKKSIGDSDKSSRIDDHIDDGLSSVIIIA